MKIRSGFVSNSSSTSFTIIVPDNFVPSDAELESAYTELICADEEKEYGCSFAKCKKAMIKLVKEALKKKDISEDVDLVDLPEPLSGQDFNVLSMILNDYIFHTEDTRCGGGHIVIIQPKDVKRALKNKGERTDREIVIAMLKEHGIECCADDLGWVSVAVAGKEFAYLRILGPDMEPWNPYKCAKPKLSNPDFIKEVKALISDCSSNAKCATCPRLRNDNKTKFSIQRR